MQVAVAPSLFVATGCALQPAIELAPSLKLTVPVGDLPPLMVAVNVTLAPTVDGLGELVSVVVVGEGPAGNDAVTAAAALRIPAPHNAVVQLHAMLAGGLVQAGPGVGNTRAVVWIFDSTCAGVSAGFTDSISDTTPLTCGVAMLVPA